jgi:hypothetical protein
MIYITARKSRHMLDAGYRMLGLKIEKNQSNNQFSIVNFQLPKVNALDYSAA